MLKKQGYDLCIIGSGVAGALLANETARAGKKVVIIEAGKQFDRSDRMRQIQHNQILGSALWPWQAKGRDGFRDESKIDLGYKNTLNDSRIKGVSDSTLHWGGLAKRL